MLCLCLNTLLLHRTGWKNKDFTQSSCRFLNTTDLHWAWSMTIIFFFFFLSICMSSGKNKWLLVLPGALFIKLLICIKFFLCKCGPWICSSFITSAYLSFLWQYIVETNALLMAKTLMKNWKIHERWPLRLKPHWGYPSSVLLQSFINRPLACFWHLLSKKPFAHLMKGGLLYSANSAERWQSAATALHFILLIHLKLVWGGHGEREIFFLKE